MRNIIAFLILAVAGAFIYLDFGPKPVTGRVVDSSGQGVPGVTVRAWQKSWKWEGKLVKNQDFFYSAQTNANGNFRLTYNRGGPEAHLLFFKMERDPNLKRFDAYFWEHPFVRYP